MIKTPIRRKKMRVNEVTIDKPQSQSLAFSSDDLDMIDNTIDMICKV